MASGAGLNRVGQYGGVPFFTDNAGNQNYITGNGPFDSGIVMLEGIGYTKWGFQLLGTFTGYSVAFYGTWDPIIYQTLYKKCNVNLDTLKGNTTLVPATSWFILPAPAEQGGTGTVVNPLTGAGQILLTSYPLVAVRCVVTGTSSTGSVLPIGIAVP